MSVRTEADEKLDETRDHLNHAIESLSEIVVDRCWGWDQFNDEYQEKLQQTLNALLKIRQDLK